MSAPVFGDADPEDGYDAGDPLHVRLRVIAAAVADVLDHPDDGRREVRRAELLRVGVAVLIELAAAETVTAANVARLALEA